MKRIALSLALLVSLIGSAVAQGFGPPMVPSASSNSAPSGAAGGVLSGTYPNPGYAVQPLVPANNLSDVLSAVTSRTNLGLVAVASSGSASDLSAGTLPAGRFPALTGDITTVAGALAATLATAQPGAHTWAATQTLTVAPIFTDASGSRSALGLGTMATQAAGAVAITGGTINGTTIGGTTPLAGAFTTLTASTSAAVGGCTIGADAACVTGSTTHNGALVVSGASFSLSGNQSAAAWTTSGIRYKNVAATFTDTTSSGTVAAAYTNVFGGSTVAASSATTYTQYVSTYFSNPIAGTNVTMTNKSALGADSISIGGAAQSTYALAVTGTSQFSSHLFLGTSGSNPSIRFNGSNIQFNDQSTGAWNITANAIGFRTLSTGTFSFSPSNDPSVAGDTILARDAANTLALRNGTTAQKLRVYNTYTDASNYEYAGVEWVSNVVYFGSNNAGTGTFRNAALIGAQVDFYVGTTYAGAIRPWGISQAGHFLAPTDNTYDIGATGGATRPRNIYAGAIIVGQSVASATQFFFSNTSGTVTNGGIYGISDGVFRLADAAGTSFGRLQFGGTTSSFPALKRSTTTLAVRLADDSADAPLSASIGTFSGQLNTQDVSLSNNKVIVWSGQTTIVNRSDGVLTMQVNAGSDFGRLQFGGTTSSFPSLKRSTTTLGVRLADDSADAGITASTVGASGQITSTLATGTAPFVVASTTVVANLNASTLGGATFAAPGTIGGTTPGVASFTTMTARSASVSGSRTSVATLSVYAPDLATNPGISFRQNNNIAFGSDWSMDQSQGDTLWRGVSSDTPVTSIRFSRAGGFIFGDAQITNLGPGQIGIIKTTASAAAPGTAGFRLEFVCGTGAGTGKVLVYAGTSGTAATMLDNIGAGLTGCSLAFLAFGFRRRRASNDNSPSLMENAA